MLALPPRGAVDVVPAVGWERCSRARMSQVVRGAFLQSLFSTVIHGGLAVDSVLQRTIHSKGLPLDAVVPDCRWQNFEDGADPLRWVWSGPEAHRSGGRRSGL